MKAQNAAEAYTPICRGPVVQFPVPAALSGLPDVGGAVPGSGNVVSNLLQSGGYKNISVGLRMNKAGSITVQRYVDAAGTVKQGAAITTAVTASTDVACNVTDGVPFMSFTVTIANTDPAAATIAAIAVLQEAA